MCFIFHYCIGCSIQQQPENTIIDIEKAMDNLSDNRIPFSNFITDIKYIPLETKPECFIGGSVNFHITDKYICTGEQIFNIDGSFYRKLGRVGKGPGEYLMALSTAINETRQEFYVLDNFMHKIFVYDLNNNYKKSFQVSDYANTIKLLDKNKLLIVRDRGYVHSEYFEYYIIDIETTNIIYKRCPENIPDATSHAMAYGLSENNFWKYSENLYYHEFLTDTIFQITATHLKPCYFIKLGKYKLKISDLNEGARFNNFIRISNISESSQYLFFQIDLKRKLYYAGYNKNTGEISLNLFNKLFNNDIDGGPTFLFKNTLNGDAGFCYFSPDWAKENILALLKSNSDYDETKKNKMKKIIDTISEENNPVIYILNLK